MLGYIFLSRSAIVHMHPASIYFAASFTGVFCACMCLPLRWLYHKTALAPVLVQLDGKNKA